MPISVWIWLIVIFAAVLAFALWAYSTMMPPRDIPTERPDGAPDEPDRLGLRELKDGGADMEAPHQFEFLMLLNDEAGANRAAARLREEGLRTEVRRSESGKHWLMAAREEQVPDFDRLLHLRHVMRVAARENGGEYEGWTARVDGED